jgi:hypothetical protein
MGATWLRLAAPPTRAVPVPVAPGPLRSTLLGGMERETLERRLARWKHSARRLACTCEVIFRPARKKGSSWALARLPTGGPTNAQGGYGGNEHTPRW